MASDAWRAVKQCLRDARNSEIAKDLTKRALEAFLERALPECWRWIRENIDKIWSWFRTAYGT